MITGPAYNTRMKKKIRWGSVVFLVLTGIAGLVGVPVYAALCGISRSELILFVFMSFATITSITVGYHRLFSHAAFKAHPLVQFLVLFFGAASFQQSAYRWASLHRTHHRHTDTELDPYNIKRGFWYAHVGWVVFNKPPVNYENVQDLAKNPLVMHQHRHYQLWAFTAGVITPLAAGAATGHVLGAALLSVAARISLVHHLTFFINSLAHSVGSAGYDSHSSSRDNWFAAILTNGEGYHNFHHRFPSDYRNGYRWYHWDPSKWVIWSLSKIRLTRDLRKTPEWQIQSAVQNPPARP